MSVVADELLLVVKSNIAQAMAGLSTVEAKASGLGPALGKAAKFGGTALIGVGTAAAGVAVTGANMALTFEESLAKIEALTGTSSDEMVELRKAALDMGAQFGVSANDAAGGLFFLKSAGLSTSDAIETLKDTAAASAIGLGDMESLANTATTAMNNFGLESGEAFDIITTAAKLAKADPAELGKILNQNSAVAALTGQSYEDLAAMSALLTRKFGDANRSGTGIGAMLQKVVKPSEQAKKAFDSIGLSVDEFRFMMDEDVPTALQTLDQAFRDSGMKTEDWIGKVFEDTEAIKTVAAILGTSGAEIEEVFGGMGEASGALDEGWRVMEETGRVKLRKAFEGVKSSLITLMDPIAKLAVPLIEGFAGWLSKLGDALSGGGGVVGKMAPVTQGVKDFAGAIAAVVRGDLPSMREMLDKLPEPFQILGRLVGGLVEVFQNIWNDVSPVLIGFVEFIQGEINELVKWWDDNFGLIKEFTEATVEALLMVWEEIWSFFGPIVETVFKTIKSVISGALDVIKGIIQTVMALVTGDWEKATEGLRKIWDGLWEAVKGILTGAWDIIKQLWGVIATYLTDTWEGIWDTITKAVSNAWEGIKGFVVAGVNGVISLFEGLINGAISGINGLIEMINKLPGINISTIGKVSLPRLGSPSNAAAPGRNFGQISALADGGILKTAGAVLVGERGPELLTLPRGAQVSPLDDRRSQPQHVHVYIGNEEIADVVLDAAGLNNLRVERRRR